MSCLPSKKTFFFRVTGIEQYKRTYKHANGHHANVENPTADLSVDTIILSTYINCLNGEIVVSCSEQLLADDHFVCQIEPITCQRRWNARNLSTGEFFSSYRVMIRG